MACKDKGMKKYKKGGLVAKEGSMTPLAIKTNKSLKKKKKTPKGMK